MEQRKPYSPESESSTVRLCTAQYRQNAGPSGCFSLLCSGLRRVESFELNKHNRRLTSLWSGVKRPFSTLGIRGQHNHGQPESGPFFDVIKKGKIKKEEESQRFPSEMVSIFPVFRYMVVIMDDKSRRSEAEEASRRVPTICNDWGDGGGGVWMARSGRVV